MFLLANVIAGVADVLDWILTAYLWIVIARAILSWVNPDPYNPIVRFLGRATDPVLHWIRRRIPVSFGGIDFSPMIVMLVILFLQRVLVRTLVDIAVRLH
ncbi:MAG: YggT family protein [Deltaproteobacteria bacterium]|nr:YggT family protein [Deltaproteobacteria bacterium]